MKMLNKVVPALILPLVSSALVADTEFGDSVPREVVNQLLGDQFRGGTAYVYSDILDAFPDFEVPDGFAVLASTNQAYFQRVILKTSVDADAAKSVIAAAFIAEGWQELPVYGSGAPQTGFVTAEPSPQPTQLCNDAIGRMSINVTTGAAPRYVSLNYNTNGPTVNSRQQTCAEQIEMTAQGPMAMRGRMGPELSQYMPRLLMPESNTPGIPSPRAFFGGGGSSNDWETEGSLISDLSIDEVFEHFTAQVNEQGWTPDSEVTGATVATASWTKTVDDMDLVGLLAIIATAENNWEMKFRILRKSEVASTSNRDFIGR